MSKKPKYEIPKADNCRECDYGNCYNEDWCECHHPLVNPSRVQISCGCVVRMWMGMEGNTEMIDNFNEDIENNLRKIADYIKKNYPESCIAYNDRKNQMSGYELVKEISDFFTYEIICLCGCGCPESTIISIRDYLQIVNDKRNDDYETTKKKYLEKFDIECVCDNTLLQFMAYILDDKGLTEHGTSILGNWITDLGKMCLYVYKLLDIEETEENHG